MRPNPNVAGDVGRSSSDQPRHGVMGGVMREFARTSTEEPRRGVFDLAVNNPPDDNDNRQQLV